MRQPDAVKAANQRRSNQDIGSAAVGALSDELHCRRAFHAPVHDLKLCAAVILANLDGDASD